MVPVNEEANNVSNIWHETFHIKSIFAMKTEHQSMANKVNDVINLYSIVQMREPVLKKMTTTVLGLKSYF